jgi:hypothetical protein
MEDVLVDLRKDAGIRAKGRRDVFTLHEEADRASEKALEEFCVDELAQAGHVSGG